MYGLRIIQEIQLKNIFQIASYKIDNFFLRTICRIQDNIANHKMNNPRNIDVKIAPS